MPSDAALLASLASGYVDGHGHGHGHDGGGGGGSSRAGGIGAAGSRGLGSGGDAGAGSSSSSLATSVDYGLDPTRPVVQEPSCVRRVFERHGKGVLAVAYSERLKLVASAGIDRTVLLWDPFNRQVAYTLTEHLDAVIYVAFDEAAKTLISVSVDKVVKVWDTTASFAVIHTLQLETKLHPDDCVSAAAFAPGPRNLVLAHAKLMAFDLPVATAGPTESHRAGVTASLSNTHFNQVVSGDEDGTVVVWDVTTGRALHRFSAGQPVTSLCLDANCRRLLVGTDAGTVAMHNASNGQRLSSFLIPDGSPAVAYRAAARVRPTAPSSSSSASSPASAGSPAAAGAGREGEGADGGAGDPGAGGEGASDVVTGLYYYADQRSQAKSKCVIAVGWDRVLKLWEETPGEAEQVMLRAAPASQPRPAATPTSFVSPQVAAAAAAALAQYRAIGAGVSLSSDEHDSAVPGAGGEQQQQQQQQQRTKGALVSALTAASAEVAQALAPLVTGLGVPPSEELSLSNPARWPDPLLHSEDLLALTVSQGVIATAGQDGLIVLWATDTLQLTHRLVPWPAYSLLLPALFRGVHAMQVLPSLNALVSAGADGYLRFWALPGGQLLMERAIHHAAPSAVAFAGAQSSSAGEEDDGGDRVLRMAQGAVTALKAFEGADCLGPAFTGRSALSVNVIEHYAALRAAAAAGAGRQGAGAGAGAAAVDIDPAEPVPDFPSSSNHSVHDLALADPADGLPAVGGGGGAGAGGSGSGSGDGAAGPGGSTRSSSNVAIAMAVAARRNSTTGRNMFANGFAGAATGSGAGAGSAPVGAGAFGTGRAGTSDSSSSSSSASSSSSSSSSSAALSAAAKEGIDEGTSPTSPNAGRGRLATGAFDLRKSRVILTGESCPRVVP